LPLPQRILPQIRKNAGSRSCASFSTSSIFRQTGRTVTGLEYRAWKMGPVPVAFWQEMKNGLEAPLNLAINTKPIVEEENPKRFTQITRGAKSFEHFLTKREKQILSMLSETYRDATAEMMVDVTHLKNKPWDKVWREQGLGAVIPPEMSMDGSTSDQLSAGELTARLAESAELASL
jgi:uncharacterized phage-associated protein